MGALRPGFVLHPGMRVGLFGGSFNPAHEGHAHVAETALAQLRLDRVIWLVTPGNPLKDREMLAPLEQRMAGARKVARGRKMIVSDLECRLGSPYTVDTLRYLVRRFPGVKFFWLIGSDNLRTFHHWRSWREIGRLAQVAVVPRPAERLRARFSPAARRLRPVHLSAPLNFQSSTALRAHGRVKSP